MPNIKPFKAIHYNQEEIDDLSKVVSPPYDVISEEEKDILQGQSPYNFTHIDLSNENPGDNKEDNKYTRAKKTFEEWLKKTVLIKDKEQGIYFYKQEYRIMGQKHSRFGFIAAMELVDEKESKVYPHENTHDYAVQDRYKLCKALNAHLSCIFVCFSDQHKKVQNIFNRKVSLEKPIIELEDNENVKHKVWALKDPKLIDDINRSLSDKHLFIADGHHRFKVAMEYRKSCIAKRKNVTGEEPFNYVMTYFTNIDSKDLMIFPMHRIIKKFSGDDDFLEEYFRIDKLKNTNDLLIMLAKAGKNEHAFGLYAKDSIKLLRLKNKLLIDKIVTEGSKHFKSLDATILKYFILDKADIKSEDIIYTKDLDLVVNMVNENQADAGFILNPVKIDQLKSIALNGEKMPPKTTYFYPKVLSGLTVYSMDK